MNTWLTEVLHRYGIWDGGLKWRLPPVDTYPRVIAFAQTYPGKLVLCLLFLPAMKILSGEFWLVVTLAAVFVSLAGRQRHMAALFCTAAMLVLAPEWYNYGAVHAVAAQEGLTDAIKYIRTGTLLSCVTAIIAVLWLALRYRKHPIAQRPVLTLHVIFMALLGLAVSGSLEGLAQVLLWSLIAVFAAYFWFISYALLGQRQKQPPSILFHLATFHPFFGSTATPLAKGAANWRDVEASSEEELAVTQLKGLKLIVWAFALKVLLWLFRKVVYGKLGITPLAPAFEQYVNFGITTGPMGAASIVANFFEQLLMAAVWGHIIIATGRLAGFRLLRNTWRPLSSRTIAEFWNRYFYYFKEVLVHIYFYPTYVRCFKRHPQLRILFATFMAAGVGNWFFHFILQNDRIARRGLFEAIYHMHTYAFYCVLLVGGIALSQLRGWRPNPNAGWWRNNFIPSLTVILFYCFLSIFDGPQRHMPLKDHFAFIFQIFGV